MVLSLLLIKRLRRLHVVVSMCLVAHLPLFQSLVNTSTVVEFSKPSWVFLGSSRWASPSACAQRHHKRDFQHSPMHDTKSWARESSGWFIFYVHLLPRPALIHRRLPQLQLTRWPSELGGDMRSSEVDVRRLQRSSVCRHENVAVAALRDKEATGNSNELEKSHTAASRISPSPEATAATAPAGSDDRLTDMFNKKLEQFSETKIALLEHLRQVEATFGVGVPMEKIRVLHQLIRDMEASSVAVGRSPRFPASLHVCEGLWR
eukprot:GHVQ01025786.1.p1 GENE.GHVQ01025786.1~~GHVQ01025786.1.p1  ORF type:complete len:262 (+),score=18.07 GHVQ01025786.1:103-888(+)